MRFNTKELAYYASTRFGKADKEGALWMKEYEGLIKKKESELYTHFGKFVLLPNLSAYTQRWFLLTGNLLFYCRDEHPVSPPPPHCYEHWPMCMFLNAGLYGSGTYHSGEMPCGGGEHGRQQKWVQTL